MVLPLPSLWRFQSSDRNSSTLQTLVHEHYRFSHTRYPFFDWCSVYTLYLNLGVEQSQSPTFFLVALSINFTLPLIGFSVIVVIKFAQRWIPHQWKKSFKQQFQKPPDVSERVNAELPEHQQSVGVTTTDIEFPDRLLHPYRYVGDPDETH